MELLKDGRYGVFARFSFKNKGIMKPFLKNFDTADMDKDNRIVIRPKSKGSKVIDLSRSNFDSDQSIFGAIKDEIITAFYHHEDKGISEGTYYGRKYKQTGGWHFKNIEDSGEPIMQKTKYAEFGLEPSEVSPVLMSFAKTYPYGFDCSFVSEALCKNLRTTPETFLRGAICPDDIRRDNKFYLWTSHDKAFSDGRGFSPMYFYLMLESARVHPDKNNLFKFFAKKVEQILGTTVSIEKDVYELAHYIDYSLTNFRVNQKSESFGDWIIFHASDGTYVDGFSFNKAYDSYRKLICIIAEICVRSFIVNGDKEPCGIVVIDEPFAHYPFNGNYTATDDIMERLEKGFQDIQFIGITGRRY